jgi:hypothetical protein
MTKRPDWIGVAGKGQVFVGVKGGLAQLSHGKKIPLQRLDEADWLIAYSPRIPSHCDEGYQCFPALDGVASEGGSQVNSGNDLFANRLEVDLEFCEEASILPLADSFPLIKNKKNWESAFRLEPLEISEEDFALLAEEMRLDVDSTTH